MKIYNTQTRSIEEFEPIVEGNVGIYACGPTVYNFAHIGNLRTYIFEDLLRRAFETNGYQVKHVMNITDVGHLQSDADEGEDKLSLASKREKRSPWEIARDYEDAFFQHSKQLNIRKPHETCRATEHIDDMITMIEKLFEKGFAYTAHGNVYFDVSKFDAYSDFARLNLADQQSTDRVSFDENKRNQVDFALWFSDSKYPHQIMKWNSPWGEGFPGWHIECSAMSSKYLGSKFDIHCGGIDHIPVHHTNEIAQSDCCHGNQTVNYWMHGAFLTLDKGKMSKSENRFITVDTLIEKGYDPLAYRYLTLTTHYRSELNFSFSALDSAQTSLKTMRERVLEWRKAHADLDRSVPIQDTRAIEFKNKFWDSVRNDLHLPSALATTWTMLRSPELSGEIKLKLLLEFDSVLGLSLDNVVVDQLAPDEAALIEERLKCRQSGDWTKADEIRQELEQRGIKIKDTKNGTDWTKL